MNRIRVTVLGASCGRWSGLVARQPSPSPRVALRFRPRTTTVGFQRLAITTTRPPNRSTISAASTPPRSKLQRGTSTSHLPQDYTGGMRLARLIRRCSDAE